MALASRIREPRGGPMKAVLLAVALLALAGLASVLLPDPADLGGGSAHRGEYWRDSESVAFADASTSGRHVVVAFGADWCVPCRKIEQIMNDEAVFGLMAESFVPLHIDITELSEHAEALQTKYSAPTLPAVIFVDAAGRELDRYDSKAPSAESFIAEMRSVVASHPPVKGVRRYPVGGSHE